MFIGVPLTYQAVAWTGSRRGVSYRTKSGLSEGRFDARGGSGGCQQCVGTGAQGGGTAIAGVVWPVELCRPTPQDVPWE